MHQKFNDWSLFPRELSRFVLWPIWQAHACIIVFTLFVSRDNYKYFFMYHKRSPSYIQTKYYLSRPQDCIAHIIYCHGKYSSFPDYTTIAQYLVDYIHIHNKHIHVPYTRWIYVYLLRVFDGVSRAFGLSISNATPFWPWCNYLGFSITEIDMTANQDK